MVDRGVLNESGRTRPRAKTQRFLFPGRWRLCAFARDTSCLELLSNQIVGSCVAWQDRAPSSIMGTWIFRWVMETRDRVGVFLRIHTPEV